MKQLANCLSLVLLGSAAIAAGCSTSANSPTDGPSGTGGSSSKLQPLLPDATGFVDVGATGMTGIKGAWYAYGDGIGSNGMAATGDCEAKGMHLESECSSITTPAFGNFPNTAGKMCTSGTAAKIINIVNGTGPDYNEIWGAGIGLDFNNGGGDAGAVKMQYNATGNGVIGMAFDIDSVPLTNLRVEFPTNATNAAFWGGDQMISPVLKGHNEILWAKVTGPFYDSVAPPFDPTKVLSIQFHALTSATASASYSFCISNLSAILAK